MRTCGRDTIREERPATNHQTSRRSYSAKHGGVRRGIPYLALTLQPETAVVATPHAMGACWVVNLCAACNRWSLNIILRMCMQRRIMRHKAASGSILDAA